MISWRTHLKSCLCSLLMLICSKFVSTTHLISFQITSCLSRDWSFQKGHFRLWTANQHPFLSTLFLRQKLSDTSGYFCTSLSPSIGNCIFREWRTRDKVIRWSLTIAQNFERKLKRKPTFIHGLFLPKKNFLGFRNLKIAFFYLGNVRNFVLPNNSAETIYISSKRGSGGV